MNPSAPVSGTRLKDKVVLVTGSTTGIGEAMLAYLPAKALGS